MLVDKLMEGMERRRALSLEICTMLVNKYEDTNLNNLEIPGTSKGAYSDPDSLAAGKGSPSASPSPARNRTISTLDTPQNDDDENLATLSLKLPGPANPKDPMRRRASSAQGRYAVPATQQCSEEVRQFVKLMGSYQNLTKSFYTIKSMREGLWTPSMAKQLAEEPNKDRKKLEVSSRASTRASGRHGSWQAAEAGKRGPRATRGPRAKRAQRKSVLLRQKRASGGVGGGTSEARTKKK